MGRTKVRGPKLRAQILDVAVEIIDRGDGPLTTRQLAAAASVSLATIDELFTNKAGLIDAVALVGFSMLAQRIDALPDADSRTRVTQLCDCYRDFMCTHMDLFDLMMSRPFTAFRPPHEGRQVAAQIHDAYVEAVSAISPYDATTTRDLTIGLIALLGGLARQEKAGFLGPPQRSAQRWATAIDTYLRGMDRPRPEPRSREP